MKKILIGMLALASFIFTAGAQDTTQMKHHQPHHRGQAMMFKGINLTADQKAQLKTSRESTKTQLAELNKNEDITVREYKARKGAIMKAQKEQMQNVLTTEQKTQLAQNKASMKAKREVMSAKRMDKMKTRLNLSDDQVSKMKASREESMAKAKAIRENTQLSAADKKDQLIALRKAQKDNFKQILTPDQIKKMEELKKDRMDKAGK